MVGKVNSLAGSVKPIRMRVSARGMMPFCDCRRVAAMMSNLTRKPIAQRLLECHLLTPEELARARAEAGDEEGPLLERLLHMGLLTPFHLRQLRAGATNFHVGKYIVLDYLGRGGNGIVYKARHSLLPQRQVALKTLDTRDLHLSSEAVSRFEREIDIVTRLEHPNIVRAYDVIRTRSQLFLVLEYIDGCHLGSLVEERGRLPVVEAVSYIVQAARGLGYAHQHGIIHRDLKPANLLLTREGLIKLSDLGLARSSVGSESGLTMKGACLGTPEFMAPEQAEDARKADQRSDLYSLGATLFHLLTGQMPVSGSSQVHCLTRLLTTPPRPLRETFPEAPPVVAEVVDRLRSRDPAARPGSAEEVIGALEPFVHGEIRGPQVWDARRKAMLVLEVLQGKTTAADVCQQHHLPTEEFERWRQRFLEGAERALDPLSTSVTTADLRDLHAQIGIQAMKIEALQRQLAERNGNHH